MDPDRKQLIAIADRLAPEAEGLLREVTSYAELPLEETRTSGALASFLASRGFRVRQGIAGMKTSFRADFAFGKGKPAFALLCEMDGR